MCVCVCVCTQSDMKKNVIMPSEAEWMYLEMIVVSEVRQRQILYDITYMWNVKK